MRTDETTIEDHDRGLQFDLPRLVSRRRALGVFAGGLGSLALAACGSDSSSSPPHEAAGRATATTESGAPAQSTSAIPEETAGPFPGDGTNGPNALADSGVVRKDITKSFGDASGTAGGVPATIELTLVDVAGGGKPLAGAAVYLWHCDREGRYSMYDSSIAGENYLRGVQESDADGRLAFETIFPAAYPGRWPHMHFEVYESLEAATSGAMKLRTSQVALPAQTCEQVYARSGYEQSARTFSELSLDSDIVFADGYASQLATASGDAKDRIALKLNVGV